MQPIELDGLVTRGTREAWALTSPCGLYRYALGRAWDSAPTEEWGPIRPVFDVFGLNPSKARHDVDDPTMRKLVHFAQQEGCGALLLRNVFAYSTTFPKELRLAADPVGARNEEVLAIDPFFAVRVAAWGNIPTKRLAKRAIGAISTIKMRTTLHVFGFNKPPKRSPGYFHGAPKHPLYLANATRVVLWRDAAVR